MEKKRDKTILHIVLVYIRHHQALWVLRLPIGLCFGKIDSIHFVELCQINRPKWAKKLQHWHVPVDSRVCKIHDWITKVSPAAAVLSGSLPNLNRAFYSPVFQLRLFKITFFTTKTTQFTATISRLSHNVMEISGNRDQEKASAPAAAEIGVKQLQPPTIYPPLHHPSPFMQCWILF